MSNGPTLVSSKGFVEQNYLIINLTKNDWCSFEGNCRINQVPFNETDLCNKCKYKKEVDVPSILENLNTNKNNK